MKKIALFLLILISGILSAVNCNASHALGGEITWTCLPSGNFRFEVKFYRDCNGITGPSSMYLETNVPGVPTINCVLWDQNDISPVGFTANGDSSCLTCAQGNSHIPIPGLVEEYIYRSAPVNLPGVPPASGWVFSWGSCCRSFSLTNIMSGGSIGYQNRAVMYPFGGANNLPCFDSSPYFAEKPSVISCTGYQATINSSAIDLEQDSLVYTWGNPISDSGAVIPFAPGYSINSQLPSVLQNPLNVPAYLDPASGEITFTSFTGGYFVTVIKVTAYKCGIRVSEIFREINVLLINNCPAISGGVINSPPIISAPFIDPGTGLQTSYTDTVNFGDTVSFSLFITDFDFFTNGNAQSITLEGSGLQFGLNFTDPDTGCGLPPCATITGGLPVSFPSAGQIDFNWVTTCDHVSGINSQCGGSSTYYFTIKAHDNYCPGNAATLATVKITIIGSQSAAITSSGPSTICEGDTVILAASGAQSYTWNTGHTGDTIMVTQPGFYSVLGASPGVCFAASSVGIPYGTLNVTASAAQNPICINWPPVQLSGNPPGGTWSGVGLSGTQFNPVFTGAGVFDLMYQLTDAVGCVGIDSLSMTVNLCTGLNESGNETGISVYPNPAFDQIHIGISNSQTQNSKIELYNVYGQKVMDVFDGKIVQQHWEHAIDISALNKGMYVFRLNGNSMHHAVFIK